MSLRGYIGFVDDGHCGAWCACAKGGNGHAHSQVGVAARHQRCREHRQHGAHVGPEHAAAAVAQQRVEQRAPRVVLRPRLRAATGAPVAVSAAIPIVATIAAIVAGGPNRVRENCEEVGVVQSRHGHCVCRRLGSDGFDLFECQPLVLDGEPHCVGGLHARCHGGGRVAVARAGVVALRAQRRKPWHRL